MFAMLLNIAIGRELKMKKKIILCLVAVIAILCFISCKQDVEIKTYTVTFYANGADSGTTPTAIQVQERKSFTVPSQGTLMREGCDFVGWNTKKDGSGNVYRESQSIKADCDIILYAQWSIHTYSISYDLGGGSYPEGRSNPNNYTIETETFTLNNPERNGYEFMGWKTSENDEPNKNVSIEKGTTGDLSFTAAWRPLNSYSVSYDANGGEGSIETGRKYEGMSLEIVSASGVSRKGYEFVCWSTEPDGTGKGYNPGDLYEEDEDLQLYAKWSIVKYSIEYNLNDGELATEKNNPMEYTVETEDIILENPTRYGCEFVGWRYTDDSDVLASTTFTIRKGTTGNLSIVAVWKALDTYTVSYDANGGTGTIETQSKYKGESLTISSGEGLERVGYTFVCWNTKVDGTGTDYNPNDVYGVDADLKLYAKWKIVKYLIQYDLNGGTIRDDANPNEYTVETDTFTLVNPDEREGYRFRGWKESGSADETAQENVSIEKGSTGNKSFIAVWKQLKKCTITFDSNGADEGSVPAQLVIYEGDSFEVPSCGSLFKDGYVFYGWNTDSDGSGTLYAESELIIVSNDTVLYAIWKVDPLKYTYLSESDSYSVECKDKNVSSIVIPSMYKGKPITNISSRAFWNCSGLTSITIPDSVTSIGDSAFSYCSGLGSIEVEEGNSMYHSEGDCLIEQSSMTLVLGCKNSVIPKGVKSIGDYAFYGCSGLTSITIPDSVTSIGESVFCYCSGLTNITIPKGVKNIENYTFFDCSGLTSVTIPASVTSIGMQAFYGCSGLTSVTIPESVTSIGDSAFEYCSGLMDVTVSDGVRRIGRYAFWGCSGLKSITIPSSVTSIGAGALSGCSELESIEVEEGNSMYYSEGDCLIERSSKTLVLGCKNSVIPKDVKSLGDYAFYGCSRLTSITILEGVTGIGRSAFYGCSGLTSVTIPESVTSIGSYAFKDCRLNDITYSGTKTQWNSITKDFGWNSDTGNYTIHCTDGDIAKN